MRQTDHFTRIGALLALLLIAATFATPALAGPYTRLQVLLPGETAAPGTATGRTGVPTPQTAGIPFYATVRACDDAWELVPTVNSTVRVLSTDASASLPPATQLSGGTAQFLVILNAGGDFTIFARDQVDVTVTDGASSTVRSIVLQTFGFSAIPADQAAGVSFPVTISARDPSGELVSGFSGNVRLRQLTSFGEGRITPSTVTMDAGQWSGSVTVFRADESDLVNGRASVAAELPASPSQSGSSNSFVVSPGPFTRTQVVVPGQTAVPGSVTGISGAPSGQTAGQSFTVQVYGTDDFWNPVATSDRVQLSSSTDPADTPVSGNLSAGARQFTYTLQSVGSQTLTVTDEDDGSIAPMTSAAIQVTPASTNGFAFTAIASPQVAGVPVTVQIRAVDSSGNTDYDYTGDAVLAANTGSGTSTPNLISFVGGVWSGPVTLFGAGSAVRLTCTDFGSPPRMGSSGGIQVNPTSFEKLQVLVPGETARGGTASGRDGTPNDQLAGTFFPVTIRAVDKYWNVVSGIGDRISVTSTDSFAHLPADTNLVGGTLSFPGRLFASGPQTITVENLDEPGIGAYTTPPIEIVGGVFSKVLVLAPGEMPAPGTETGRTGMAVDQSINYAFTLTVLATDQWWNPVPGPTDMVRISSTDPLAELPPDAALVDGRVELPIRLSTGGYQTIEVEDLTNPSKVGGFTEVRAISSGFHLVATTEPAEVQAGAPFTLTVSVTNDAGALIQEINSAITVEVINSDTGEPGGGTLLTPQFELQGGQRTVPQTYTRREPVILVVRDDQGSSPASSNVLNVLAGPPAELRLSSDPEWVRGNRNATISALLVDQFDNGVPAESVYFEHISGSGVLTPTDQETGPTGVARADFLSPRFPEMNLIRASSGSFSAELDLQVALVDPAANGGYITNYPNPFHPTEAPTTIAWKLDNDASVHMRIFTLAGQLVYDQRFDPGQPGGTLGLNEVSWDGRNGRGDIVASGGYILTVEAESGGETIHHMRRKMGVVQ